MVWLQIIQYQLQFSTQIIISIIIMKLNKAGFHKNKLNINKLQISNQNILPKTYIIWN